jgi:O-antigen ligase
MSDAAVQRKGPLTDLMTRYLSLCVEYGIYLYIFFLLFDKGEALRNIGVFGSLAAWVVLRIMDGRVTVPRDPISLGLLVYLLSVLVSSSFSINPSYSFGMVKRDLLKPVIIFFLIAGSFDFQKLLRLSTVICVIGVVLLMFGLHGLLTLSVPFYTSENAFLSLDKNEFGFYMTLIAPFFMLSLVRSQERKKRFAWSVLLAWLGIAAVLSGSRGSVGAILTQIAVFALFFMEKRHAAKALYLLCAVLLAAVVTFNFWPGPVKSHMLKLPSHIFTMSDRVDFFWKPALEAVEKRPLAGWGYGAKIYRDERPFEGVQKPHWEMKGGLHSTFMAILFHQGIVGLISFVLTLAASVVLLTRAARQLPFDEKPAAVSLVSIMVGAFVVNGLILEVPFERLAPFLGMAVVLVRYPRSNCTQPG